MIILVIFFADVVVFTSYGIHENSKEFVTSPNQIIGLPR